MAPVSTSDDIGVGAIEGWPEHALRAAIAPRDRDPGALTSLARRLFSYAELKGVISRIETEECDRPLAALAEAIDLRFAFNGLENIKAIGDRPVILYANHPTGGGNVLGLATLLASQFPDYRIMGNRRMKFVPSLAAKMIPVDPFCSSAAINLESLLELRREFGTQYQALGVFPAGVSSQLQIRRGTIADRRWSDAFARIARHHDALLLPVWFSGRNRLRYYLASKIRTELGFLALPGEFLALRGKTITVNIGKPISPETLQHIPNRYAQMSFLRAAVYELSRERAAQPMPDRQPAPAVVRRHQPSPARFSIPIGNELEAQVFDGTADLPIPGPDNGGASAGTDQASLQMILTPRSGFKPLAHWRVLDWRQFTNRELEQLSPIRRAFRLPADVAADGRSRLEVVSFAAAADFDGVAALRASWSALRQLAAGWRPATELVGLVKPRETNAALASLQLSILQASCGDAALLRARAKVDLIGAARQHDWRPSPDLIRPAQGWRRQPMLLDDPLLRACAGSGVRFGAFGISADRDPRPCILARLQPRRC